MNSRIVALREKIEPLKQQIVAHPVYNSIKTITDVRTFMEHHIYAVWDFMSLLKALQNNLTCTSVPWFPKGDAETRFLVNEIVCGEESDIDEHGQRCSHYELYLQAMKQTGADTSAISSFIAALHSGKDMEAAMSAAAVPSAARDFMNFTFEVISSGKDYLQAAVFCFGREDLIPDMFHSIVNDISKDMPEQISTFKYYLERHIEVDGDHHSQLALDMTAKLCGNDPSVWQEVEEAVIRSLQMRIHLWNGVQQSLVLHESLSPGV